MSDPYLLQAGRNNGKLEKVYGWQNHESVHLSSNMLRVKLSHQDVITEVSGNCGGKALQQ